MLEDWRSSLDQYEYVGAVLMDLSKAFDCIPHEHLTNKLTAYGLSSSATMLISNYLSNRNQRVKIGNTTGSWLEIAKGVPQGSILGPLMFNIFINDIFLCVKGCSIYNYADDNTISAAHRNIDDLLSMLENASKQAIDWFEYNYMLANPNKFQAIILEPGRTTHCVSHTLNFRETSISSDS